MVMNNLPEKNTRISKNECLHLMKHFSWNVYMMDMLICIFNYSVVL